MKQIFFTLFTLISVFTYAQELNPTVKVNYQQIQLVDPSVFTSLEQSITEFLLRKWTDDVFEPEERIDCNFILTLEEEVSATSFKMTLAVQSSRPIYGTDQSTAVLNVIDSYVNFNYEQYQPLQFSDGRFDNNLTSVLAFYANVIIGMDYDSFELEGGEPFFVKAQEIVNSVPAGFYKTYPGWSSTDPSNSKGNRNRYWIAENMLSSRMSPLRKGMYQYHRLGLDIMHSDVTSGRAAVAEVVASLGKVDQSYPNAIFTQLFSSAKRNELLELFKRGTNSERSTIRQVMTQIDPSNASKYRLL